MFSLTWIWTYFDSVLRFFHNPPVFWELYAQNRVLCEENNSEHKMVGCYYNNPQNQKGVRYEKNKTMLSLQGGYTSGGGYMPLLQEKPKRISQFYDSGINNSFHNLVVLLIPRLLEVNYSLDEILYVLIGGRCG